MILPTGTTVELNGLTARSELNGRVAIVVTSPQDDDRYEAFVVDPSDTSVKPEGIRVRAKHMRVVTSTVRERVSAWNELGNRFVDMRLYTRALEAFECGLSVSSEDPITSRLEGCDSLSCMAWLCLRMNRESIELESRRVSDIVDWCLQRMFASVLNDPTVVTESSVVKMGAGHVPECDTPVFILNVDETRCFYYDDTHKVVREWIRS